MSRMISRAMNPILYRKWFRMMFSFRCGAGVMEEVSVPCADEGSGLWNVRAELCRLCAGPIREGDIICKQSVVGNRPHKRTCLDLYALGQRRWCFGRRYQGDYPLRLADFVIIKKSVFLFGNFFDCLVFVLIAAFFASF